MANCKTKTCGRSLSSAELEAGRNQCAVCIVKSYKWALVQAYKAKEQAETDYKDLEIKNARLHAKLIQLSRTPDPA